MRNILPLVLPSAAAILAPTVVVTLFFSVLAAFSNGNSEAELKVIALTFISALAISTVHVLALGLPFIWILKRVNRLNVWSATATGFLLGCVPMGIWSWPYDNYKSSYRYWNGHAMVDAKIDGVPTLVGWIDYLQSVTFMGAFGVIAALAFWWTLKCFDSATMVKQDK